MCKFKTLNKSKFVSLFCGILLCFTSLLVGVAKAGEITAIHSGSGISFVAYNHYGGQLHVSGESGSASYTVEPGGSMHFTAVDNDGEPLADGIYNYQLELMPSELQADLDAMAQASKSNDEQAYDEISTRIADGDYSWRTLSGQFKVALGLVKEYDEEVEQAAQHAAYETYLENNPVMEDDS